MRKSTTKQGNQKTKWAFTFNNITLEQKIEIEHILKKNCEKYIFELEIGDKSKIEHLQAQCRFNSRKRLTEIKKIFPKEIHWSETNSEKHSVDYCTKDAVKKEDIHAKGYYNEKMMFFDLLEDATNRLFNFEFTYNDCIDELINEYKHTCDEIEDVATVQNLPLWKVLNQCYNNAIDNTLKNIPQTYEDVLRHFYYKQELEKKLANSLK